jgi:hypothetical protein
MCWAGALGEIRAAPTAEGKRPAECGYGAGWIASSPVERSVMM